MYAHGHHHKQNRYAPYPTQHHSNGSSQTCQQRHLHVVQTNRAPDSQATYKAVKREFFSSMNPNGSNNMDHFLDFLKLNHPQLVNRHLISYKPGKSLDIDQVQHQLRTEQPGLDPIRLEQIRDETKALLEENQKYLEENEAAVQAAIEALEKEKKYTQEVLDLRDRRTEQIEALNQSSIKRERELQRRMKKIRKIKALEREQKRLEQETKTRGETLKTRFQMITNQENELEKRETALEAKILRIREQENKLEHRQRQYADDEKRMVQ